MAETSTLKLPGLPLGTGGLLPLMVTTIALETPEAKSAVDAANGGPVLVVPRLGRQYASVGTVAQIEDSGELRNGLRAIVVRGLHRVVIGSGVPGDGEALW